MTVGQDCHVDVRRRPTVVKSVISLEAAAEVTHGAGAAGEGDREKEGSGADPAAGRALGKGELSETFAKLFTDFRGKVPRSRGDDYPYLYKLVKITSCRRSRLSSENAAYGPEQNQF